MIAKACGVARTLLYKYFRNKRAIFNEAIDEVTDKVRARYEEASASLASADQKLHRVCFTVFELLFDNRNFGRLNSYCFWFLTTQQSHLLLKVSHLRFQFANALL